MGTGIDQEAFAERDYARFRDRLERCLSALGQLRAPDGRSAPGPAAGASLMTPGDLLVLPPRARFRACQWPGNARKPPSSSPPTPRLR